MAVKPSGEVALYRNASSWCGPESLRGKNSAKCEQYEEHVAHRRRISRDQLNKSLECPSVYTRAVEKDRTPTRFGESASRRPQAAEGERNCSDTSGILIADCRSPECQENPGGAGSRGEKVSATMPFFEVEPVSGQVGYRSSAFRSTKMSTGT